MYSLLDSDDMNGASFQKLEKNKTVVNNHVKSINFFLNKSKFEFLMMLVSDEVNLFDVIIKISFNLRQ